MVRNRSELAASNSDPRTRQSFEGETPSVAGATEVSPIAAIPEAVSVSAAASSGEDRSAQAWSFLTNEELVKRRERLNWSGIQLNHQHYNYLVSGDPDRHFLSYFINKYIKTPGRVLSLGCGNGHLERVLVGFGLPHTEIVGMDLNPDLMSYASQEAAKLGYHDLRYEVADLNRINLPRNSYDLVIFFHSLHHVDNLEGILESVKNTLTDHGLLLVVDFIGPTRWQWTDKQLSIAQQLLDILPDDLKIDLHNQGSNETKSRITRPLVEDIVRIDPSESIRSGDILALLHSEFKVLEERSMGGTVLSLLFDGIAGNFDEQNPYVRALIRSLQKTEELLIANHVLPPDYIFMVLGRD